MVLSITNVQTMLYLSPSLRHQAMAASFAECFLIYMSRPSSSIREPVFLFYSSGSTRSHNGVCVIRRTPQPQLSLALQPCSLLRCDFLWTIVWLASRLGVPQTLFPSEQPLQPYQLSQNSLAYLYPMWADLRPHYSSSLIMLGWFSVSGHLERRYNSSI